MLRKMILALAILAMLIPSSLAMTSPVNPAMPAPDMQTITLNTGFNHSIQAKYPVASNVAPLGTAAGPLDAYWTVVSASGAPLNSAFNINKHPAWSAAQADSQWISYSSTGSQNLVQGPYYYQKCFCMTKTLWQSDEAVQKSVLDISVKADDAFYLGLNTIPDKNNPSTYILATNMSTGAGGFSNSNPFAVLKLTGNKLTNLLRPGRNCLTVRVDDMGGVITGFNLAGSLTTAGIDGIAKVVPPSTAPQFDSCSSCSGRRINDVKDVEVKSSTTREGLIRAPQK